jgi:hypothetical protein
MTIQVGSAVGTIDYKIELSDSDRYIVFCPVRPSTSEAELIQRWTDLAKFSRHHGTLKVLFDHRDGVPTASVDMVAAALKNPNWTEGERWRIAILLSHSLPNSGISHMEGIAEFVGAIGHEAEVFWDLREAEKWLLREES